MTHGSDSDGQAGANTLAHAAEIIADVRAGCSHPRGARVCLVITESASYGPGGQLRVVQHAEGKQDALWCGQCGALCFEIEPRADGTIDGILTVPAVSYVVQHAATARVREVADVEPGPRVRRVGRPNRAVRRRGGES